MNDPGTMQGTILSKILQIFSTPISGTGSALTLMASTDGGSEAFVFQNIVIAEEFAPRHSADPAIIGQVILFGIFWASLTPIVRPRY